jgi:hypothetical protein
LQVDGGGGRVEEIVLLPYLFLYSKIKIQIDQIYTFKETLNHKHIRTKYRPIYDRRPGMIGYLAVIKERF